MSGQPLCIRTFAETLRDRMSKKAQIKNFDTERNSFQSDAEVRNQEEVDLSHVHEFYKLLLESVIYLATLCEGDSLPDISSTMTSQLKTGKEEVHNKIKEIAQAKGMKTVVADFFVANLVPNMPVAACSSMLDDIHLLASEAATTKRKKDQLRTAFAQRKSDATYLAEIWLLAICNGINRVDESVVPKKKSTNPLEIVQQLSDLIAALPAPKQIAPPNKPLPEEQAYICELYAAYGDKEGVVGFCEAHLLQFADYAEDLSDRRIDYFAAEAIRCGVRELAASIFENQFDVLKEETLAGIKNTARRKYPDGYEKLLSVMEQVVCIEVKQYILSQSPNWISNRIKAGVCHFLVNDGKLRWVSQ